VIHLCNTGGRSSGFESLPNVFSRTGEIKLEDLENAIAGRKWRVNNEPPKGSATQKDPAKIKQEALELYTALQSEKVPYSPGSLNCEHFAKNIRHGEAHSEQVSKKLAWLNVALKIRAGKKERFMCIVDTTLTI